MWYPSGAVHRQADCLNPEFMTCALLTTHPPSVVKKKLTIYQNGLLAAKTNFE